MPKSQQQGGSTQQTQGKSWGFLSEPGELKLCKAELTAVEEEDKVGKELVMQEHMQEEVLRGKALARKSASLLQAKKQTCLIW